MRIRKMDWGYLVLRIALGLVFMAHGAQKLFGWFGGRGLSGTAEGFGGMGLNPPMLWAVLIGSIEFFGGLLVLIGLLTRLAALAIAINMAGAIVTVHGARGFFLPGGYEYNMTLIAICIALIIGGAGVLSLDWRYRRQRRAF